MQVAGDAGALLLLGAQRGGPGAPPLRFEAAQHAQEGELDPLDLLGLADPVDRLGSAAAGRLRSTFSMSSISWSSGAKRRRVPQQGGKRRGDDGKHDDEPGSPLAENRGWHL